MRVKLLKKVRKRFYYKVINENKFDGYVLIDKNKKEVNKFSDLTTLIDSIFYTYYDLFYVFKRRSEINKRKQYNKYSKL